jgi:hypothetical protein
MTKEKKSAPKSRKEKGITFMITNIGGDKEKRAASPYNQFMKTELGKVKKSNPNLSHKDAFKVAAQNVIYPVLINYYF